ncbi:MAG: 4'-phosphopantetheinyl transferase superfamily protein [Blastocatellia bacterium]
MDADPAAGQFIRHIPPEAPALSRKQVHLWRLPLNLGGPDLHRLQQTLASDERARAERFYFERDRRRFIAARGQLRMILGRYVGVSPRALVISYGARGKPFLGRMFGTGAIKFNLSHSAELALVAVSQDRDIGVDLEEVRALDDAERIAERFFAPRENAALLEVPEAVRTEAFFCCWTLKEAYVKATGDGLARPTESFEVSFAPSKHTRLLSVEGDSREASRWSLVGLAPERGYIGALAVEGHGWTVSLFQNHP